MTGFYTYNIDKSMRLQIPKKFLTELAGENFTGQTIYIIINGKAISVFSEEGLNGLLTRLQAQAQSINKTLSDITPLINKCIIDQRGRITLPRWLANRVSIYENTTVSLAGCGASLEIWNSLIWGKAEKIATTSYILKKESAETLPLLVFISYCWDDWKIVEEVNSILMNSGYRTFLDRKDIIAGEYIYDKIQKSIDNSDYYLFFATDSAIASEWCKRELSQALEVEVKRKKTFIIPLKLSAVEMPGLIRNKKYIDLRTNKTSGLDELLKTLLRLEGYEYSPIDLSAIFDELGL